MRSSGATLPWARCASTSPRQGACCGPVQGVARLTMMQVVVVRIASNSCSPHVTKRNFRSGARCSVQAALALSALLYLTTLFK